MELRICIPNVGGFINVEKSETGEILFSGPLAPWAAVRMEIFRGFNVSFWLENSIGSISETDTEQFTGCVGSLHNNLTEAIIGPLNSIFLSPNIKYTVVDGFEKVGILSGYLRSNSTRDSLATYVLDMVFAFSSQLWILTGTTLCLLLFLLTVSKSILSEKGMRERKFWQTMAGGRDGHKLQVMKPLTRSLMMMNACIFKQHSSTRTSKKTSFNLLYLTLNFCCFIVGFYLTSMISTDMVIVKRPVTVESYQDILDSGIRPVWSSTFTNKEEFEHGFPGSMERKIWDRAVAMGIEESMMPATPAEVFKHVIRGAEFKQICLLPELFADNLISFTICSFMRTKDNFPDNNLLYKHDPDAKESLKWNVLSRNNPLIMQILIRKRLQTSFEFDRKAAADRLIDFSSVFAISGQNQYYRSILECSSQVVVIDRPLWQPAAGKHYYPLTLLVAVCLVFAMTSFIMEKAPCIKKASVI